MKGFIQNYWEKGVLALMLVFVVWCWREASALDTLLTEAKELYESTRTRVVAQMTKPVPEESLDTPEVEAQVIRYFVEARQGEYSLPTSPSAGFETLKKIIMQEGQERTVSLTFTDENLRQRFQDLTRESVTCQVIPEGIVKFQLLGGTQIRFTALKYGKAVFNLRDQALNGARLDLEIIPTLKFYAWMDPGSLTAKADPENLNLVHVDWELAGFSHTQAGLGGVQGYTLQRRHSPTEEELQKAPWREIGTWTAAPPTAFSDQDIEPSFYYQYRMIVRFWVKTDYDESKPHVLDAGFDTEVPGTWQIKANESREYTPSAVVAINPGIELVGFTDVQDKGKILDPARNRIARVVIRKWHGEEDEPARWLYSYITLDRLAQDIINLRDIRRALENERAQLVQIGKVVSLRHPANPSGRIEIDFRTNSYIYAIKTYEKGRPLTGVLAPEFISPEEIELFTVKDAEGQRVLKETTWAFYVISEDGENRKIHLAQEWRGRELQRLAEQPPQKDTQKTTQNKSNEDMKNKGEVPPDAK